VARPDRTPQPNTLNLANLALASGQKATNDLPSRWSGVTAVLAAKGVVLVDSDLDEAVSALKKSFAQRRLSATFGKADLEHVQTLAARLHVPRRYREFLLEADPTDVETRTPSECIRLVPSSRLLDEQKGYSLSDDGEQLERPNAHGWRPNWVIVGHSSLLGDPYFLDTASPDAEGDCPVFTAMSGTELWKPQLCASSFALFVRILAISMEVAEGFAEEDIDTDDESVFREAVGPKIRQFDPAALKAGHWT